MTMTDDSLLKTGNSSGGQSGLRYNPRQTAGDEVGYGVSHTKYNPRDPDEKATDDDEKEKKKEKRKHAKAGLQHIKVKVKNKKREEEEARKKEAEISDLTGPAASRGGDLDQAVGAMTGTGSAMGGGVGGVPPELPGTGAFGQGGAFVRAFAVLKDRDRMGTETLESRRATEAGEKAHRTKRQGFMSMGGARGRKGGGKPLQTRFRGPEDRARQHVHQRVPEGERLQGKPIISHLHGRGKSKPAIGQDSRIRHARILGQEHLRDNPRLDISPTLAHQTGRPKSYRVRGRARPKTGSAMRMPPTASTPGGAGKTPKIGQGSPFAMSRDVLEIGNLLLKSRDFNQSQIFEIRQLLRDAKKLLEGLTKKGYMPGQGDDAEGPSPNSSRKQTSYNTGATEVDDDWGSPLDWGAHPYGLLVGRRGQP